MRPKRYKVQCCDCKAIFNNDYRIQHENAIHKGKKVSIQDIGAAANPSEAAMKKRKVEIDHSKQIPIVEGNISQEDQVTIKSSSSRSCDYVFDLALDTPSTSSISNNDNTQKKKSQEENYVELEKKKDDTEEI